MKTSEPIQGDMSAYTRATWQIPSDELRRVGVNYLSALDRFVDKFNRFWQPESRQAINIDLFENTCVIDTVRVDPPSPPAPAAKTGI